MLPWPAWLAIAYIVGSIPFGVLIGRVRGVDVRTQGSRNIGATNVGRVLGKRFGIACLALDMAKGAAPVLAAGWDRGVLGTSTASVASGDLWLWLGVAACAVTGHCASVFLVFRGGKGVATGFGALLGMWPILTLPAIGALVVWATVRKATHYVSLASMAGACSLPAWCAVQAVIAAEGTVADAVGNAAPPIIATGLLAAFVAWRHRGNIARLRRGEEPRA